MKKRFETAILALALLLALASCAAAPTASAPPTASQTTSQLVTPVTASEQTSAAVVQYETVFDGGINLFGDEEEERVNIKFALSPYADAARVYDTCILTVGETAVFEVSGHFIYPPVKFRGLDTSRNQQICINDEGPSGDPAVIIVSYDGAEFKMTEIEGFIVSSNGNGEILTHVNYLPMAEPAVQISRYEYADGEATFVALPKAEFVGKSVSFTQSYPLVFDYGDVVGTVFFYNSEGDYYRDHDDESKAAFGDNYAFLLRAGEEAEICDIEYVGVSTMPWVKLRNADGHEGWLRILYGD